MMNRNSDQLDILNRVRLTEKEMENKNLSQHDLDILKAIRDSLKSKLLK